MTLWEPDGANELTKRGTPRKQSKSARGTWSRSVALDPRHRPQSVDRPSSTVRREWARAPQEAHLLDERNARYRRLTVSEIAILQGFDAGWFEVAGVSDWDKTSACGDAVPPALGRAVLQGVVSNGQVGQPTSVEICAGAGGLASAAVASGLEHIGLYESWLPAARLLRADRNWSPELVHHEDVREVDWSQFRGKVGLLSGGPPCQPWSVGGVQRRVSDQRDLLGQIHELVTGMQPDAFVFENVPGLTSQASLPYLSHVLGSLRAPGPTGLRYGVVAGTFDAADYGVPQRRRRVFIVGLRSQPNAMAYNLLDRVHAARTHRSPHVPDSNRVPWVTVGEALAKRPDPGGWRTWAHDYGGDEVGRSAAN